MVRALIIWIERQPLVLIGSLWTTGRDLGCSWNGELPWFFGAEKVFKAVISLQKGKSLDVQGGTLGGA